jgi:hypothetical protein
MATVLAIAVVGQEIRRLEICKERVQYARRKERRRAEVKEGGRREEDEGSVKDGWWRHRPKREEQECRPPWQRGGSRSKRRRSW